MALATTCPSCKTSFKVNPEQLKLRKGLVRCGKCQHVFSGIQYLRYINESRKPKPAPRAQPADPVAPETVAEDLNTAFFLPDTRLVPETTTGPDSHATGDPVATTLPGASAASPPTESSPGSAPEPAASSSAESSSPAPADATQAGDNAATEDPDTISPDTLSADTMSPDTISPDTVSPDTVSAAGDGKNASSRRSRKSRRARRKNRRKNKTAAAQTATPAAPARPEPTAVAVAAAAAVAGTAAGTTAAAPATTVQPATDDTAGTASETATGNGQSPQATNRPADAPVSADTFATDGEGEAVAESKHHADAPDNTSIESSIGTSSEPSPGASTDKAVTGDATQADSPADDSKPRASDEPVPHASRTRPGQDDGAAPQSHWLDGLDEASGDSDNAIADEEDAIDFFGQTTRPVFDFDLPPRSVWMAAGALGLLLTLQLALGARDSLAAWFPSAKPVLESVSNRLGLQVQLPLDPDAIRIESHDLANAPASEGPGAYVLNLLIRNHADITLRWPAIELTLTDRTGANILVRKALLPADYLADGQPAEKGMPPLSEQAVRLNLRTQNIGPMHGYTAVLFYP